MGILADFDLDNVPEAVAVPEGEYEGVIVDAGEHVGKTSGKTSIRVVLDLPGEANADTIYHYLSLPTMDDDEKTRNRKLRRIKDFLAAFGLTSNDDYADWVGRKAWMLVGVEEDDQTGLPRNTIKRFITTGA